MPQTVLLLGGTGRTGRAALAELLARDIPVRAIVRSAARLPAALAANPRLAVIEAELLALPDETLRRHVEGCSAVISCLGHTLSLRGVFGPPRDLVAQATTRLCGAIDALRPPAPVKFILMSSVSVNRPSRLDARRGDAERAVLWLLRAMVPPARDNQRAADFLVHCIGAEHPHLQWVVLRPDSLVAGDVSAYNLHEGLVDVLIKPGRTSIANVAHCMAELVTDSAAWGNWSGRLPVIVNGPQVTTQGERASRREGEGGVR